MFCNGILPPFVMHLPLINEKTFLFTSCVFILDAFKIMTISIKLELL